MKNQITTPILLIAFNRPDTTIQVFNRIGEAKPQILYVAVDGPRKGINGEEYLVNKVKSIVQNVDWPCETHYFFNSSNLGAEVTVSSAITWALEKEEFLIILEDDIIAPMSFFQFCQEMLIKYKDHPQIFSISGSNFTPIPIQSDSDYFFAKYGHSWGWATWKRAWEGFDLDVEIPKKHLKLNFLKTITNTTKEARYYQKRFKKIKKRGAGNSTWDSVGLYKHRLDETLSIIPKANLTSNIGIHGLHATGRTKDHFRTFDESFSIKNHPKIIECNIEYDIHHFEKHIYKRKTLFKRIMNKIRVAKSHLFSLQNPTHEKNYT